MGLDGHNAWSGCHQVAECFSEGAIKGAILLRSSARQMFHAYMYARKAAALENTVDNTLLHWHRKGCAWRMGDTAPRA